MKYAIGDKGFAYELPEVVQDPKCGILIKELTFEATETKLTPDQIKQYIWID